MPVLLSFKGECDVYMHHTHIKVKEEVVWDTDKQLWVMRLYK